jgi:hypothetical protein
MGRGAPRMPYRFNIVINLQLEIETPVKSGNKGGRVKRELIPDMLT